MEIVFGKLAFEVIENKICMTTCGDFQSKNNTNFVEVQIAGENKNSHLGGKMVKSSEGGRFQYVSHEKSEYELVIRQKTDFILAKTVFHSYDSTNTISAYTEITNISDREIVLEEVSALVISGIGQDGINNTDSLYFTRFIQSHHAECQPFRNSFSNLGFLKNDKTCPSQKRISFANIGSWSTKEELPQGIVEDACNGSYTMFQIESNASWYYEISDREDEVYLYLGGANLPFGGWSKRLSSGESHRTLNVALSFGNSLNEVVGEMTKYRRNICGLSQIDSGLPAIFNEYMHLSWDSPTEENTRRYAPVVAKTGVEYYVIDCGWHNEEPGDQVYPYVGQWKESKSRFPQGVRATTDYIRSHGMKAGLWIEPEVIGIKCQEMLDYYDDSCFIQRNGRPVITMNRYFLDYRNTKVIDYMTETIRRMVEDYGADYIKLDYNQDLGVGTDYMAFSYGEGLELCAAAFLNWVNSIKKRFPQVVFEGCASGGLRMDYKSLSVFSLMSTSDQIDYLKYPYIAGNILSAVIPEQAAVWSYPVGKCSREEINDDQIIMNMINSFLGRMHLASHLEWMNEHQLKLVQEGVEFYKTLSDVKKDALPYFPKGFTSFGEEQVCAGFRTNNQIYLAVWCLGEECSVDIEIDEEIENLKIAYPFISNVKTVYENCRVSIVFDHPKTAVFLVVEIKEN